MHRGVGKKVWATDGGGGGGRRGGYAERGFGWGFQMNQKVGMITQNEYLLKLSRTIHPKVFETGVVLFEL